MASLQIEINKQKERFDLFVEGKNVPEVGVDLFSEEKQIERYSRAIAFSRKELRRYRGNADMTQVTRNVMGSIVHKVRDMFPTEVQKEIWKRAKEINI